MGRLGEILELRWKVSNLQAEIDSWSIDKIGENEVTVAFCDLQIKNNQDEIARLHRKIDRLVNKPKDGDVTESMIASAREYPIEDLFDNIQRGRVIPFCHDSDSFTGQVGGRNNIMYCHKCHKAFNPIDVLVERDGLTFIEAAKRLSRE